MSEKCEHSTGTVVFTCEKFSIVHCDWGCGEYLIELNVGKHEAKTITAAELAAMQAALDEARGIIIELDALSEKDKQPRSYEEASLAVVRMMSMGVEAMNKVQELEHELAAKDAVIEAARLNEFDSVTGECLFDCGETL